MAFDGNKCLVLGISALLVKCIRQKITTETSFHSNIKTYNTKWNPDDYSRKQNFLLACLFVTSFIRNNRKIFSAHTYIRSVSAFLGFPHSWSCNQSPATCYFWSKLREQNKDSTVLSGSPKVHLLREFPFEILEDWMLLKDQCDEVFLAVLACSYYLEVYCLKFLALFCTLQPMLSGWDLKKGQLPFCSLPCKWAAAGRVKLSLTPANFLLITIPFTNPWRLYNPVLGKRLGGHAFETTKRLSLYSNIAYACASRTFTSKISHVQIFLKLWLQAGRKWYDKVKNVKKIGGHRTRFEDRP